MGDNTVQRRSENSGIILWNFYINLQPVDWGHLGFIYIYDIQISSTESAIYVFEFLFKKCNLV